MMLSSRSMNLRRSLTWLVFCLYRERASAYSLMRTEDRKRHSLNFSSSRIRPEDDLVMADGQIGLTLTGVTNCQCGGEIRSDELNLREAETRFCLTSEKSQSRGHVTLSRRRLLTWPPARAGRGCSRTPWFSSSAEWSPCRCSWCCRSPAAARDWSPRLWPRIPVITCESLVTFGWRHHGALEEVNPLLCVRLLTASLA